jgi:cytochrome b subunit of formate dehydrogenase
VKSRITRFALIFFLLGLSGSVWAQAEVCTECHSDPTLKADRLTGPVSLTVTLDSLKGSPHEGMTCTDCHADLKGVTDFPHGTPKAVNCGTCHSAELKTFMEGFFKKLNDMGFRGIPACTDCHGVHHMAKKADTRRVCGLCHQAELKALKASIHGEQGTGGKDSRPLVCTSCHEPHFKTRRGTVPESEWRMSLVKGCMKCHSSEADNYLNSKHYQTLAAGDTLAPTCLTCHGDHDILSPSNPAAPTSVDRLDNLCAQCHAGYVETLHRKDGADPKLMTCVACHTGHETQMVRAPGGAIFKETVPATCNRCHGESRHKKEMSAHGKIMLLDGAGSAANCTQCHVYHWRKGGQTHEASLRQQCQNCHVKETQEYNRSIHAIAREKGHMEAPTCTTCHGERDIQKVAVSMRPQRVIDLCSRCHANREIALKFQLNPDVVKSYKKTYHGQVYDLGYQGAEFATCINCHGNHDIRAPKDPESAVNRQNIVKTCARCHKEANEKFVGFLSHYDPHGGSVGPTNPNRNVSVVERLMNGLLLGVFGFFGLHTILWAVRSWSEHRRNPKRRSPASQRTWIRRFSPWQRTLHVMLFSTFLLQAMTGLPLKFSHSIPAYWVAGHIIGLRTMAVIHRVSAGVLIGAFSLHVLTLLYLKLIRRKKGMFSGEGSLVPRLQDLWDMIGHFKWFLWKGPRPKFGRWTYWEKFDYFAVFWGVIVIGFSGLVLWFPEYFTQTLPGWMINLAHVVHSEEALLATGFIFTVHFFNGHLRPGKFPFDDVIFTGRESTEEMAVERARELEHLEAEGKLESLVVPPMRSKLRALFITYGWLAFAVGIVLLGFILASSVL